MRFQDEPMEAVLRINIPQDSKSGQRQEYQIRFRSECLFRQALQSLASHTRANTDGKDGDKKRGASGWLLPSTDETNNSGETQVKKHRTEALEILEGFRRQPKYLDWEGCFHESYFNRRAMFDVTLSKLPRRMKPKLTHQAPPEEESHPFVWENLHFVLADQITEHDRAYFPAWRDDLVPSLLMVGEEDHDGVQKVKNTYNLRDCSVFEFRMLMLDVAVRGWRDVLWLSFPDEKLPLGFRNGRAKVMFWGGADDLKLEYMSPGLPACRARRCIIMNNGRNRLPLSLNLCSSSCP